jgi:hypothetical protein
MQLALPKLLDGLV